MPKDEEVRRWLGRRIRELAKARGIPLTHLADRAGTTRSHLWNVLAGDKSPTVSWLVSIANALGVEPSELISREPKGR